MIRMRPLRSTASRLPLDSFAPSLAAALTAALFAFLALVGPRTVQAESDAATTASIEAAFDRFVAHHGGLESIGSALGPAVPIESREGMHYRDHQNFKLEYWPELADTPYEVQPALLGVRATDRFWFPTIRPFRSEDSVVYFPETGHSVRFGFLDFFRATGGIELLGYPISEEIQQDGITFQYFQRGGLKYIADDPIPVQPLPLGQDFATRAASPWHASVVTGPAPAIAAPGSTVRFLLEIRNTGSAVWQSAGADRFAISYHWKSERSLGADAPLQFPIPSPVSPGGTVGLEVDVPLPDVPGPFSIIWDPKVGEQSLSEIGTVEGVAQIRVGSEIPDVRVGILELGPANDEDTQATISATADFTIETISGVNVASVGAGVRVTTIYSDGVYQLQIFGRESVEVAEPITFTTSPTGLMIVDEIQPGSLYRGSFEFRYSPELESSWLINILPMDDYLAGLIEQGESAPTESQKASVIAFRSYALAVQSRIRRKNLEPFDLASSTTRTPSYFTRHQFYVGVRRDYDGDRLRETIEATRGQVITFEGKIIESVYFSQAGGRTYSWADTWGPPGRAWALGVDDPVSAGFRQVGHGVGMPLRSANALAGLGYAADQILKSYYSDVELSYAY
ncbi:MAG: SpoIID/LytB domain-containing protein [Gammaproteobacteria bacterium]|nr:SpoIID/LytB domain-containing protein [Gammaproteobacteria bacterium]